MKRVFYGYYLAAFAFSMGFTTGCVYLYSRGVFVRDQIIDFDASRTEISLVFTTVQVVSAFFAPVLGYLLDRFPIRNVMMFGAFMMACGFTLLSRVETLVQFGMVAAVFLGFGVGCVGTTGCTKLMVNWFNRRRGFALGIAIMGYSAAGAVMAPIALYLLDNIGWRGAYMLFAGVCAFGLLPAIWLIVRQKPSDIGLGPDGDPPLEEPTDEVAVQEESRPVNRLEAFIEQLKVYAGFTRSVAFWGVVFTFGLMAGTFGGFNVHLFLHYTELGIAPYSATLILSYTSGVAIASKPMFGWLVDHSNPRTATMCSCVCNITAMLVFSFADVAWMMFVAGTFMGLGFGGMVPVRASIISRLFRLEEYARAYGSLRLCMFPLTVMWTPLIGYIHDTSGSYMPAFNTFAVLFSLSALLAFFTIPRSIPDTAQASAVSNRTSSRDQARSA